MKLRMPEYQGTFMSSTTAPSATVFQSLDDLKEHKKKQHISVQPPTHKDFTIEVDEMKIEDP